MITKKLMKRMKKLLMKWTKSVSSRLQNLLPILLLLLNLSIWYAVGTLLPHYGSVQYAVLGLGAAAILGGSAVLGGALGLFGSSKQVDAQEALNAQQQKNWEREFAWNQRIYDDMKRTDDRRINEARIYNSPLEQVKRFRAAGLNPSLLLNQMDAGQLQSVPSASGVSAPVSPTLTAPDYGRQFDVIGDMVRGVGSAVSSYFDNELKGQQAKQLAIRNLFETDKQIEELNQLKSKTKEDQERLDNLIAMRDDLRKSVGLQNRVLGAQADELKASVQERNARKRLIQLQEDWQAFENDFAVNTYGYRKGILKATLRKIYAETNNVDADTAKKIVEKNLAKTEDAGIKIDNFQKNKINWLVRRKITLEGDLLKWHKDHPYWTAFAPGAASAIGGAIGAFAGRRVGVRGPVHVTGFQ